MTRILHNYVIISRAYNLMWRIMSLELGILLLMAFLGIYGGLLAGSNLTRSFASGHSMTMSHVVNQFEGTAETTIKLGMTIMAWNTLIALALIVFELVCYIQIFLELKRNDERIGSALSQDILRYRKKRNVLSLSGQLIGFFLESMMATFIAVMLTFHKNPMFDISIYPINLTISSAIVSLSQFLTSAELKRYYFNFRWLNPSKTFMLINISNKLKWFL